MTETRSNLGLGVLALIPIACCIGLPLIAAAGISIGLAAWVGGVALAAFLLIAAVALLVLRVRRHRENTAAGVAARGRS
jgi:asparagine N-glycosylation enzyme membrane subunit Stt3